MVSGASFTWLLLGVALVHSTPLRQRDAYGNSRYEYDVKHPSGSSRVLVRTGGNSGGNYPHSVNNGYNPQKSYVNSHAAISPFHGEGSSNRPVYVEHSYSPHARQESHLYPTYDVYSKHPGGHGIPRGGLHAGPIGNVDLHSGYSHPHAQQIVGGPKYNQPNHFEQHTVVPSYDPVPPKPLLVQQTTDDIPVNYEPNSYNHPGNLAISQIPEGISSSPIIPDYGKVHKDEQSHIDIPLNSDALSEGSHIVLQEPLDSKELIDPLPEIVQTTKNVPIHPQSPKLQQEHIDVPPPNAYPIPAVNYDSDNIVSQDVLDSKPLHDVNINSYPPKGSGIIYDEPNTFQAPIDNIKQSPIVQTVDGQHLSQDTYEPSFSNPDLPPKHLFADQPNYHFIPIGEPYEKFSHSTEIIHPRSSHGPFVGYPHNPTKTSFKNPLLVDVPQQHIPVDPPLTIIPNSHSVKVPPPQEHINVDPVFANIPSSHSVKLPPHPQEPVIVDLSHTKNPPLSHSVKLPPHPQEQLHIDTPLIENPPLSHSVKLPPQEPIHLAPVSSYSVKLPPQEPIHIVPVPSHSVKLPPQEPIHVVPVPSHSVKLPPPEPIHVIPVSSHSVKLPPQEPIHVIPVSSHSVKLPPQEPTHVVPIPSHSVKLPPLPQEHTQVDVIHTKNPPISHSIKLPPHPQELLSVDEPLTQKNLLSHSIKLPPQPQQSLHIDEPSINIPPSHSIKLPPQEPHFIDPRVSHSVKLPAPSQELLHEGGLSPSPHSIKSPPLLHSVKLPPPPQELLHEDELQPSPHSIKIPAQSIKSGTPSVKIPPVGSNVHPEDDQPSAKILSPISNEASKITSVPNLFAAVPSTSDDDSQSIINVPAPVIDKSSPPSSLPVAEARISRPNYPSSLVDQDEEGIGRQQRFPAFPVESALKQQDPVADKVSDLSQGYRSSGGYDHPNNDGPEEDEDDGDDSNSPDVNDARLEVDRISKEIGSSFGLRLPGFK